MKRQVLLFFLFLPLLAFATISSANVLVDDADSNTRVTLNGPFFDATVPTGSGMEGDYQIIACGVTHLDQTSTFSPPTPGAWTELDMGACGGSELCTHGIWGRFADNPASESITCAWTVPADVFAAGSFRYNEVDPIDPIIAVECDSGFDFGVNVMATAPSVETIAGSQVVRIFTYRNFDFNATMDTNFNDDTSGNYLSIATLGQVTVSQQGTTELVLEDGPTGTASLDTGLDGEWRACTIALRMAPLQPIRNVPTLSEWGFMAVAVFMGAAGVWYLRRRQAQNA